MTKSKFVIIYDTYCGWCYGAAPVFDALVESGAEVEALHRHLFQGPLAYRMNEGKGAQVLKADAQIQALTGQEFSEAYRENVVLSDTEVLASHYTAQAAALVHDQGVEKEFSVRRRLEIARYIEGVSAANRDAVISALVEEGVEQEQAEKIGSPALIEKATRTTREASNLMEKVGAFGVPTVLKVVGDNITVVDHAMYYAAPEKITELVD